MPETPAEGAEPDDHHLAASLARGDLEALAQAFDQWNQRVRVLALRLLADHAAAEDVVQEVFTALPRAVRTFRGDVDLYTFVLAIAVKRSRHHRRSAARRLRALARLSTISTLVARPRDPEQNTWRLELGRLLGAALERLPAPQREAFVLCEVEELSSSRAAVMADVPEATIRTRLHHARRRLRQLLAEEREP